MSANKKPRNVMVNGLGSMGSLVAKAVDKDPRFNLIGSSLTEKQFVNSGQRINNKVIHMYDASKPDPILKSIKKNYDNLIIVDFSKKMNNKKENIAVLPNLKAYIRNNLYSVIGATAWDSNKGKGLIKKSKVSAVIGPNMFPEIVGYQKMFEIGSTKNPDIFDSSCGYVEESHQKAKGNDTSGTAKKMIKYLVEWGICNSQEDLISVEDIVMVRDPKVQQKEWGIPAEYLNGHGHHYYSWKSSSVSDEKLKAQLSVIDNMFYWLAGTAPGLFKGYKFSIADKCVNDDRDLVNFRRSMQNTINKLGADKIEKEDDKIIAVPRAKYVFMPVLDLRWENKNQTAVFGFNIRKLNKDDQLNNDYFFQTYHLANGRDMYVQGTLDSILYAAKLQDKNEKSRTPDVWEAVTSK